MSRHPAKPEIANPGPHHWWKSPTAPPLDDLRRLATLSPREREVAELLAAGLKPSEIGPRIGCTPKTVDSHRLAALRKTACRNVADLARFAIRVGLVAP